MLAVVFLIILFSLIAFGNNDESIGEEAKGVEEDTDEIDLKDENEINIDEDKQDMDSDSNEGEEIGEIEDVDVQQVDSIDENVIVAFTGNWPPIGTEQEGTHTTDYKDGSADRIEIKRAVSQVTGIYENEMIEHWVGNDGEQKVVATVSSKTTEEIYRAYLSWVDREGWQVTKVERLKELKQL